VDEAAVLKGGLKAQREGEEKEYRKDAVAITTTPNE
jgi:hypothetical protein